MVGEITGLYKGEFYKVDTAQECWYLRVRAAEIVSEDCLGMEVASYNEGIGKECYHATFIFYYAFITIEPTEKVIYIYTTRSEIIYDYSSF